jgi:dGTPase
MPHSLEVAQISKSIAIRLNSNSEFFKGDQKLAPDLVEFAGLAHNPGPPPPFFWA